MIQAQPLYVTMRGTLSWTPDTLKWFTSHPESSLLRSLVTSQVCVKQSPTGHLEGLARECSDEKIPGSEGAQTHVGTNRELGTSTQWEEPFYGRDDGI